LLFVAADKLANGLRNQQPLSALRGTGQLVEAGLDVLVESKCHRARHRTTQRREEPALAAGHLRPIKDLQQGQEREAEADELVA